MAARQTMRVSGSGAKRGEHGPEMRERATASAQLPVRMWVAANISVCHRFSERSKRPLQWADLPEGRLTPRPPMPQSASGLSPPAGCAVILRETPRARSALTTHLFTSVRLIDPQLGVDLEARVSSAFRSAKDLKAQERRTPETKRDGSKPRIPPRLLGSE